MIIHFMQDEKFIDSFIDQYSRTHKNSEAIYYVYGSKNKGPLKHVKNKEIQLINLNEYTLNKILQKHRNINYIFFHSFPKNIFSICQNIPRNIKIGWIFYGVEIYQNVLFTQILDDYSEKIYPKVFKKKSFLKIFPTQLITLLLLLRERIRIYKLEKVLSRIDLFCHWNRYDYERVKELFPKFRALYTPFGYNYSLSELKSPAGLSVSEINTEPNAGNNLIMIGHSATVSLNHLTIIEYLRRFDGRSFEMICPVSYGDMEYKEYLVEYANSNEIGKLRLMEGFIPFQDYAKFISTIDVLVMNNIRAQGGSNIALALEMGKKVYMNPQNTHYKYFVELGFKINSTVDLLQSTVDEILTPLSLEEKSRNRELINNLTVMTTDIYTNLP